MSSPPPRHTPILLGHQQAENQILSAIHNNRLAHAWIITGRNGIGKATLAYHFSRYLLNNTQNQHILPISPQSTVFHLVQNNSHPDFLCIERQYDTKGNPSTQDIPVELVRSVPKFFQQTPALSPWRITLIDNAEYLNIHGQNALLKILEEPPQHALLLLITPYPSRLLPTIRSRCRLLRLNPLPNHILLNLLQQHNSFLDNSTQNIILQLSQGSIGQALFLLEHNGIDIFYTTLELLQTLPQVPWQNIYPFIDRICNHESQEHLLLLLQIILWWIKLQAYKEIHYNSTPTLPFLDIKYHPLQQKNPQSWADLWSYSLTLFRRCFHSNLDRKNMLLSLFTTFHTATQPTPPQNT